MPLCPDHRRHAEGKAAHAAFSSGNKEQRLLPAACRLAGGEISDYVSIHHFYEWTKPSCHPPVPAVRSSYQQAPAARESDRGKSRFEKLYATQLELMTHTHTNLMTLEPA